MSNLFVLDLCDTSNTQDPRDGRTSLMTAVLDNDEVSVAAFSDNVGMGYTEERRKSLEKLDHSMVSMKPMCSSNCFTASYFCVPLPACLGRMERPLFEGAFLVVILMCF